MSHHRSSADTWVVVEIHGQAFAIPTSQVREILIIPEITAVPLCGPEDRGVINIRGSVIPLIDMRKRLGWQALSEEIEAFVKLMAQREQDHRNWLEELDRSVVDGTEFRLATDPRKCAFGKWYYSYKSDSLRMTSQLAKFEAPHNRIHALAAKVGEMVKAGQKEKARQEIQEARTGTLRQMIALFQEMKDLVRESRREMALVINSTQKTFAIAVDQALAVEPIPAAKIRKLDTTDVSLSPGLVERVAERKDTGQLAMILEVGMIRSAPCVVQ
jgi:purine-binding chemotaxis protein CheW